MKYLIFISLIILISSCQQVYVNPKLTIVDNLTYDSNGKVLNGRVDFYSGRRKSNSIQYKEGIISGKWVTYGHTGETVQMGMCKLNNKIKDSLSKFLNVDFVIEDNWEEGDNMFRSIYICMKNSSQIKEDITLDYFIRNKTNENIEVLFLHNTDTLRILREN